jgi:hypothetical protein
MFYTGFRTYVKDMFSRALGWRWLAKPTPRESALIDSLRSQLSGATFPQAGPSEAERAWAERRIALRRQCLQQDPRRLLSWKYWQAFCPLGGATHLRELRSTPDWNSYWKPALREPAFGQPPRCLHSPWVSGFRIWQAYVLYQLHELTQKRVADFPIVLEFGGGYGALSALSFPLGFRGTYLVFDLPEFSLLQTYYLKSIGIPVWEQPEPNQSAFSAPPNAVLVSDLQQLERWLQHLTNPSLFLSVLGLTDTSMDFRERFLPLLSRFEVLFFLYQPRFREVDNLQWREHLKCSLTSFKWSEKQHQNLGQNRLLVGIRSSAAP